MMHKIGPALHAAGDAFLSFSPYINGVLGLVIVTYIVHRLICCADSYNRAELACMGAIASGMVMATPALWMPDTPFDGWSFNVARVGIAGYIITGGLRRDRHARRNAEAKEYAAKWLARKRREK